jgi:hypothetical protein
MSKLTLTGLALPLFLLFASPPASVPKAFGATKEIQQGQAQAGTLQKMIVENGSVTMDFDGNQLSGIGPVPGRPTTLQFSVAANSFFPILVFNELLRGPEPGSMALIPAGGNTASYSLPAALRGSLKQLVIEKLPSGARFDLAVRDGKTGFTFFNIEGHQYDYDATGQFLSITGGRLLIAQDFAAALGRAAEVIAVVGRISIGAAMEPTEITQIANGQLQSLLMPPLQHAVGPGVPNLVPGPDVIVGNIQDVVQRGSAGTQVGLAIGTDSCNNGDQPVDWFALPQTDHPLVPQNLYRMSGGTDNTERFEQVGHSWMKHTFEALEDTVCGTCNTSGCQTGTHLCPGCSDPYVSSLNGDQTSIGSRAWVNPFTGSFPSTANNHSGHNHDGVSHRIRVEVSDLNTTQNPGAIYFGEAAYISPHEYTWCQSHPDQCNMFNNVSYRKFSVSGTTSFTFTPLANTVRMEPAIQAWADSGATVNQFQPDPGNDGIFFVGYNVTNPSTGVWHYEFAIYDENLDRAIQSFRVPIGPGVNVSNIGFHAPPQEPGWANDGTFNNLGYSSTPWNVTQDSSSITWSTDTFATNQNANAIRWGTLYNFRFDADQSPNPTDATVGFFKTGGPMPALIQAPGGVPTPSPTPTPTATPTASPTATATATATSTPTATATATATFTPTPTATSTATATLTPTPTATATPRPTPTPRSSPPPRPRPTPPPRP